MRILHANLVREFRGGERQTLLLAEALHQQGLVQSYLLAQKSKIPDYWNIALPCIYTWRNAPLKLVRGFDIIHAHEAKAIMWAYLNSLFTHIPYVITRRLPWAPSKNFFTRRAYNKARKVICLSEAVYDAMKKVVPSNVLEIIPSMYTPIQKNEGEINHLRRAYSGCYIVGNMAALVDQHKGQTYLIEAARLLGPRYPSIRFLLLGQGKDEEMLRKQAQGLDNVEFLGFRQNIADYLSLFDVFAFPSLYEGLGSIVLDAMHHECAIVATDADGVRDLIKNHKNGLLVPIRDARALANAIEQMYQNHELAQILAQQAKIDSADYSPEVIAARCLQVYQEVI